MIESAGMRWYLAFTANSLPSVLHAVEAGLGLSILPRSATGLYGVREAKSLGPVPSMDLSLYAWEQDETTVELASALIDLLARE